MRDSDKEKFWRAANERFETGKLTLKKFCDVEKINKNTFQYWRAILKRRDAQTNQPQANSLVPVRLVQSNEVAPSNGQIEIRTEDGLEIRLPLDCKQSVLSSVLAALRTKRC